MNTMSLIWIVLSLFSYYQGSSEATTCTTRGRYPNNMQTDCRGYTMCLSGATDLINYDLICPEHSIYSHIEKQCTNVTSYQCLQNYNCTEPGKYSYEGKSSCDFFVACVSDLNNITTARLVRCPQNEVFNPQSKLCVNRSEYVCKVEIEESKVLQVFIELPSTGNFSINYAVSLASESFSTLFVVFLLCYSIH